jgi:hypothetical protein
MLKTGPPYKSVKPPTKFTSFLTNNKGNNIETKNVSNVTRKLRYPILAEKSIKLKSKTRKNRKTIKN